MKCAFSGKIEGIESEEEMRLIDADYLLDVLLVHNWHGNDKNIVPYKDRKGYRQRDAEVREAIINAPNVAVVVDRKNKGEWIRFKNFERGYFHIKCSKCGQYWSIDDHAKIFKYCFNCGADMRGKKVRGKE